MESRGIESHDVRPATRMVAGFLGGAPVGDSASDSKTEQHPLPPTGFDLDLGRFKGRLRKSSHPQTARRLLLPWAWHSGAASRGRCCAVSTLRPQNDAAPAGTEAA